MLLNLPTGDRSIFVTPFTYALGKAMGVEAAGAEFMRQIAAPTKDSDPPVKMINRLQAIGDVTLWHGWCTELPKLRSRAAWAALTSGCDQWLMLDDDVECDTRTLRALLEMAGRDRIAVLPCILRSAASDRTINVVFDHSLAVPTPGGTAWAVRRGGTGLMVVGRGALKKLHDEYREALTWLDDDGVEKVGLFEQRIEHRQWLGEDYAFCTRARAVGIEILAPSSGLSLHDGRKLDLASIEVLPDRQLAASKPIATGG